MNRRLASTLVLAAVLVLASIAAPQQSGVQHPPDAVGYVFRYTIADARTTEVCLHPVDAQGALTDRVAPAEINRADAYTCSTTFATDGTTVNRLTHVFSPPLTANLRVALRAYNGPTVLPSIPSNWHELLLQLQPPILLD